MFRVVLFMLVLGPAAMINAPAAAVLEEITVTAQKKPERVERVPISLSVLSGDFLATRGLENLEQLSANHPGLDISRNSAAGKVFMRGIGSQGNAGLDQSVSVFLDEIYHGRSRSNKAILADVERIEVLRGPQSTYFGMNSSAGAVAVTTRKAELDQQGGYLRSRVGSDGWRGLSIAYNLPVTDRFAVRAVADYSSLPDVWTMVDPLSGKKTGSGGGGRSSLVRLATTWRPAGGWLVNAKLEAQEIHRQNPYAWQPGRCNNLYGLGLSTQAELDRFWADTGSSQPSPLQLPFSCLDQFADGRFDSRSPAAPFNASGFNGREGMLRVQRAFAGFDLVATTGIYRTDFVFEGNDLSHGGPDHRVLWVRDDADQVSQEIRLQSSAGPDLAWMAGIYWHATEADYETGDADGRNVQNPQFVRTRARQDETTWSAFASAEYSLGGPWTATAGLRYINTEKQFSGSDERIRASTVAQDQRARLRDQVLADRSGDPAAYGAYGTQLRAQFTDERRSFDHFLPALTLSYRAAENAMAYYSWRRGFKAGGFNFRLNGLDRASLTYDSESASVHEIGLKGRFLDQRLGVGVAAFVSDYDDLQQNSNRGDDGVISAAVIRNAARASSDGIELDASWQLAERWRADLSLVWLDARFDDYRGADCTRFQSAISRTDVASRFGAERNGNRCSQDLSGKRLTSAPEWSWRLGLNHQVELTGGWVLQSGLEWIYSDGFFTSPHADSLRRQPAFDKFNGEVSLYPSHDRWRLTLSGTNLLDRLTARQLGQDQDAAVSGLLDDPRRVSLQLVFNF